MALGLQSPWQAWEIAFAPDESGREELNIMIVFPPGSRFAGGLGMPCPVHDTKESFPSAEITFDRFHKVFFAGFVIFISNPIIRKLKI